MSYRMNAMVPYTQAGISGCSACDDLGKFSFSAELDLGGALKAAGKVAKGAGKIAKGAVEGVKDVVTSGVDVVTFVPRTMIKAGQSVTDAVFGPVDDFFRKIPVIGGGYKLTMGLLNAPIDFAMGGYRHPVGFFMDALLKKPIVGGVKVTIEFVKVGGKVFRKERKGSGQPHYEEVPQGVLNEVDPEVLATIPEVTMCPSGEFLNSYGYCQKPTVYKGHPNERLRALGGCVGRRKNFDKLVYASGTYKGQKTAEGNKYFSRLNGYLTSTSGDELDRKYPCPNGTIPFWRGMGMGPDLHGCCIKGPVVKPGKGQPGTKVKVCPKGATLKGGKCVVKGCKAGFSLDKKLNKCVKVVTVSCPKGQVPDANGTKCVKGPAGKRQAPPKKGGKVGTAMVRQDVAVAESSTPWGMIALGVLGVAAVGGGIYFVATKKKGRR